MASSSRSPAALRASGLRRSGASVASGPSAGPGARASPRGRSAFAAGAAPTTAFVERFGSGNWAGRGVRLEGFPVGVVEGRSGPQRRRSWPRVKAARTRLPGWELAVGIGGIGECLQRSSSARRGPGTAVDGRPTTPGAAATGTLGPARPPPTSPSTLPAPG